MPDIKRFYISWFFGAISGFTIMISSTTLFWLSKEGVDIQTVGLFALVSLPYSINFIWAPILDLYKIKYLAQYLGGRLSWLCCIQVLLALFVFILGYIGIDKNLSLFAFINLIISFLSSTQDSILGAIRSEIIQIKMHGPLSGVYIFGYRVGMLLSSAGGILLSSYISWMIVYIIFAVIILFFVVMVIINRGYISASKVHNDLSLDVVDSKICDTKQQGGGQNNYGAIIPVNLFSILRPIGSVNYILLIILFLILYRLPDNFINTMIYPFLLHLGYNSFEISTIGKFSGVVLSIFGGVIASFVMIKYKIIDSLLTFGILHGVAHSMFILQEAHGHNTLVLFFVMGFESITGGMAMSAYLAFIMSLCKGRFRATQYAFFTAMMGVSRSFFPVLSGYVVAWYGWSKFFFLMTIATIPSLVLIFILGSILKKKRL